MIVLAANLCGCRAKSTTMNQHVSASASATTLPALAEVPRSRAQLERLRAVLPPSKPWEQWLEESGELPPDFDALPSHAGLPDPLTMIDGQKVRDGAMWQERRLELLAQFHQWLWGNVPPPPTNLTSAILEEKREPGVTIRRVLLRFGPDQKAQLHVELLIPDGAGPFPVFMTQTMQRPWAILAASRGYVGCIYSANDKDDDSDTFIAAYPKCDWSRLTRRAWAAGRCVDYLRTLKEVDFAQIALGGHSRNGKQTVIAGALDDRIAVVISGSSGEGGAASARLQGSEQGVEGLEAMTRVFPDWLHPRARFFAGNEHKLPVDFSEAVSLCAPRACLMSTAMNDPYEVSWSVEQTYLSARTVYQMLGVPQRLRIAWRQGGHEILADSAQQYLDWCDLQFGRGHADFPERFPYPHDWEAWRKTHGPQNQSGNDLAHFLGDEPARPGIRDFTQTYGHDYSHTAELLNRREPIPGIDKEEAVLADDVSADIYRPTGLKESGLRAPAVLFLHTWSYSKGYAEGMSRNSQFYRSLVQRGFVVICFDQIGCGYRAGEIEHFYDRYPRWSLLGKMTRDARSAIDVLLSRSYVDPTGVYIVGHGLGALVGICESSTDNRIAGAALVGPPPPFRTDTNESETGGIRRWSHQTMLLPQLGHYIGRESQIPCDWPELLAAQAPRPILMIAPKFNRHAPYPQMTIGIESIRRAYQNLGVENEVTTHSPDKLENFDGQTQSTVIDWLVHRTHPIPPTATQPSTQPH